MGNKKIYLLVTKRILLLIAIPDVLNKTPRLLITVILFALITCYFMNIVT